MTHATYPPGPGRPSTAAVENPPSRSARFWRGVLILLCALLVGALTIGLTYLFWRWSGGPRSEAAAWLEGVSTLAAFMAAATAAWYASGVFKLEVARVAAAVDDPKKAQAALVECWYEARPVGDDVEHGMNVFNGSNRPVRDVVIWTSVGSDHLSELEVGTLHPTTEALWFPFGKTDKAKIEANLRHEPEAFMHMIDSANRDWYRSEDGYLRRPSNP